MKKLLIILLCLPFTGFGQKQIEKKIQTKNGTIILYTDGLEDVCTTGERTLLYTTKNKDYSYYLGFDLWFSVNYSDFDNDNLDEIIIQRCNTNCISPCWESIVFLKVENDSLMEFFSIYPYDEIQISDNWNSLVVSTPVRIPGVNRFDPIRYRISTYSYKYGKFKKIKEVVTLDKFENFNLVDLEETKTIRIE